jgi:glutathionylspermidine synthase
MKREIVQRRPNFRKTHDDMGFYYDVTLSSDNEPYWREGVAYQFNLEEVEAIEAENLEGC